MQDPLVRPRAASRPFNVHCPVAHCDRVLGVARILPDGKASIENVRYRPDPDGTIVAKPSRPKVKWVALEDGRMAVACPCGERYLVGPDDLEPLLRRAIATGVKDIVLTAKPRRS